MDCSKNGDEQWEDVDEDADDNRITDENANVGSNGRRDMDGNKGINEDRNGDRYSSVGEESVTRTRTGTRSHVSVSTNHQMTVVRTSTVDKPWMVTSTLTREQGHTWPVTITRTGTRYGLWTGLISATAAATEREIREV